MVTKRGNIREFQVKNQFWMSAGQLFDDGRYQAGRERFGASDAQLARRRIGEKVNLIYAPIDLVEDSHAALQECAAVERRLCPMLAAIQESHTEHLFQVSDRLGNDGLGDRELLGGLAHGA